MTSSTHIDFGKLYFEEGIPAFAHLRFFHLVKEESSSPIFSLLSLEDENISFWLVDPFSFFKEYEFTLKDQYKDTLKIEDDTQVIVLNIATVRPNNEITVNLKAPIVINLDNKMAKQVILEDDRFQLRQPLLGISAN